MHDIHIEWDLSATIQANQAWHFVFHITHLFFVGYKDENKYIEQRTS